MRHFHIFLFFVLFLSSPIFEVVTDAPTIALAAPQKKPAARKPAAKKPAAKKPTAAKKPAARKPAPKPQAARKPAAKKTTAAAHRPSAKGAAQKLKASGKHKPQQRTYRRPRVTMPKTFCVHNWVAPIQGRVSSAYGYREYFKRNHYGVDFSLRSGDTIRAVADGVVSIKSFEGKGYGNWYQIDHEGQVSTRYAHLKKMFVKYGEHVKAGQVIGIGGNTGRSTGPHLHFEIRVGGKPVDPATVFDLTVAGRYKPLAQSFTVTSVRDRDITAAPVRTVAGL